MDDLREELGTLSASRIDTFLTCPRKFWYKYKQGLRKDETDATRKGTRVHEEAERYLKGEIDRLTEPELVLADKQDRFPPREDCLFIEEDVEPLGIEIAGIPLNGEADLIYRDGDDIVVRDWKTRSSFDYAPDAVELADDLQMNVYGWVARHLFYGRDEFILEHVNLLKDNKGGPEIRKVRTPVKTSDIEDFIKALEFDVRKMLNVYAKNDVSDVEKDTSSCFKYGMCYYKREHTCDEDKYQPGYLR
jgi:RecB family exonuclease